MKIRLIILCILFIWGATAMAQIDTIAYEKKISAAELYKYSNYKYFSIYQGDTIPLVRLNEVVVFSPLKFKNQKDFERYTRLVRDVKKTYPYAQMIAASIIETYEYMETLPNEKAKQKHLEEIQKYMIDTYKPAMSKMTKTQGKILVKLIDRECNSSSYVIVKALLGTLKATMYNAFAGLFGNSLKSEYAPNGKDREIENIVLRIKDGTVDDYYLQSYY